MENDQQQEHSDHDVMNIPKVQDAYQEEQPSNHDDDDMNTNTDDYNDNNNIDDNDGDVFFVAVHCGAGYHSPNNSTLYRNVMKQAVQQTINQYFSNINTSNNNTINGDENDEKLKKCLNACSYAISILENSPFTNAGFGSNLNRNGQVECDACLCFSSIYTNNSNCYKRYYSSVGCIRGIYNPILFCNYLIQDVFNNGIYYNQLKLIKPIMLCGMGAFEYVKLNNLNLFYCNDDLDDYLISEKSKIEYNRYKQYLLNTNNNSSGGVGNNLILNNNLSSNNGDGNCDISKYGNEQLYDTVGCIVYYNGILSSGVSSGGISLKYSGRIGEASIYGSGCYSDTKYIQDSDNDNFIQIASNFSGIGEDIMINQMSNYLVDKMYQIPMEQALFSLYGNLINFTNERKIGCMTCKVTDYDQLEFGYTFSTESMGIAFDYSNNLKNDNYNTIFRNQSSNGIELNVKYINLKQE